MKVKSKLLSITLSVVLAVSLCPAPALASPLVTSTSSLKTQSLGKTSDEAMSWLYGLASSKTTCGDGECVALIKDYYNFMGSPLYKKLGNANNYNRNEVPSGFTRLFNVQPQRGDILVFTGGEYGHVCIYESEYVTYHQNYNYKRYVTRETMHWTKAGSNFSCVIRPEFKPSGPLPPSGDVYLLPGVYTVTPKCAPGKCLDVTAKSTAQGANVQVYDAGSPASQNWTIARDNGGYKFLAQCSKMALDVDSAGTADGTNVKQWPYNRSSAQNWAFRDAGDGYYYIRASNGKYLDVSNGSSANGANVQIWTFNATDAQKWKLVPVSYEVLPGMYEFAPAAAEGKRLDVTANSGKEGANVQIYDSGSPASQSWTVLPSAGGYILKARCSGMLLDVDKAGTADGTNVKQWPNNGNDVQKWKFQDAGNGYMYIRASNGKYLDVSNGSSANGANVQIWTFNETAAQKWRMIPVDSTVSAGIYELAPKVASDKRLDVKDSSKVSGANVQILTAANSAAQQWRLSRATSGYTLKAQCSGMLLDVHNAGSADGTNVKQEVANGNAVQRWTLQDAGDGYYFIRSSNGKYLDVQGGHTSDGTNVQIYTFNETNSQKWKLIAPTPSESKPPMQDASTPGSVSGTSDRSSRNDTGGQPSQGGSEAAGKTAIGSAAVTGVKDKTYTGKALAQSPTVTLGGKTLKAGTDYTLSYANNVKAGTATMTVKGKGSYTGTKQVKFTIAKASVKSATAAKVKAQKYKKGKAVKPNPKLTYKGKTLKKGTDYTLSYKNNKKRGTATITVKGKGNFTGSKAVKFKIK